MNGGRVATSTTTVTTLNSSSSSNNHNNSNGVSNHTTGSRKRKRGLAPRKTPAPQSPSAAAVAKRTAAAAAAEAAPALPLDLTTPPPPPTLPLQNGHPASTKSRQKLKPVVLAAAEKEELLAASAVTPTGCSMCGKVHPHPLVDMRGNVLMKRTLNYCCMVPTQNLESTLAAICVQCVYKINAVKDVTNSFKIRLRRLTNGQIRSAASVEESQSNGEEAYETMATMATTDKSPDRPEVKEAQKLEEEMVEKEEEDEEQKREMEGEKKKQVHKEEVLETSSTVAAVTAAKKSPKKHNTEDIASAPNNCRALTEMEAATTISISVEPSSDCVEVIAATAATAASVSTPATLTPLPPLPSLRPILYSPITPTSVGSHNKSDASSVELLDRSITPPPYSPVQPQQQLQPQISPAAPTRTPTTPELLKVQKTSPAIALHTSELKETAVRNVVAKEKTPPPRPTPPPTPFALNTPQNAQETALAENDGGAVTALTLLLRAADANACALTAPESPNLNHSMLEVFCERSESALITESGGTINNYARHSGAGGGTMRRLPPPQLTCTHCARVYWRKDHYARHVRRCGAQHRRAKSLGALSRVSAPEPQDGAAPKDVEDAAATKAMSTTTTATTMTPSLKQRIFRCSVCAVTVDRIGKLREHKRIHMQRYYCSNCGSEFTTVYAYEFHRVSCIQLQQASSDTVQPRMTRSRSRAASQVNVVIENRSKKKTSADVGVDKVAEAVPRHNVVEVAKTELYEDEDDERYAEHDDEENSDDGYDDDEDDDVTIDTMYTKRQRFTSDWVANQRGDLSSPYDHTFCDDDEEEDNQFSTYREYDFYLLDRLNMQVKTNSFSCFTCEETMESLPLMMIHDYVHHSHAFFYCNKCGRCFTSKVFLDYHLERQNFGVYRCNKCEDYFEFQQQLHRHLIRHTKCVNYRCNECRLEFLTESKLLLHCDNTQHNPNADSKCNDSSGNQNSICIDPTMTLVSHDSARPPPDEQPRRRSYSVRILDWRLPRMPSKRPLQLPPDYRLRIGQVQFADEDYPNCL